MENQKDKQTELVPGVGRLPYPAYRGNEPYIFVSYAHLDKDKVFEEIKRFNEAGFHVWYDEGISPGNEWTDEIADALEKCSLFVVMITPTSAPRQNVINEINFALDENKPFLAIHLEETKLKGGLKLRIGAMQAILKYNMSPEEYAYKYTEAFKRLGLKNDKAASSQENAAQSTAPTAMAGEAGKPSAKKRKSNDFVVRAGMLKKYTGTDKDLVLPSSVSMLNASSFKNCNDFIESVDLNNVRTMMRGTFSDCPNLHTVKASKSLTPINPNVFENCPNLTLYIRRNQIQLGAKLFEDKFCGKKVVYLD